MTRMTITITWNGDPKLLDLALRTTLVSLDRAEEDIEDVADEIGASADDTDAALELAREILDAAAEPDLLDACEAMEGLAVTVAHDDGCTK